MATRFPVQIDNWKVREGGFAMHSAKWIVNRVKEKRVLTTLALSHNNKTVDNEPKWGDVDKSKLPRNAFADQGEPKKKSTWQGG